MLTFNVVMGNQGLQYSETSCDFFLRFSFFSIRPTDPISGNAFDAKRKKRGYVNAKFWEANAVNFNWTASTK